MTRATPPDAGHVLLPRRGVQIAFGTLSIVGLVLGYVIDSYAWPRLEEWLGQMHELDPAGTPRRTAIVLACLLGSMALSGLVPTAYFWLMAYRIFQARRFPPRGYPVLSRIMVIEGHPAIRKAVEFVVYGILAMAITAYVIFSVFEIFPQTVDLLRLLYG